ncbi:DUF882 domain-containing protein [Thermodesulfobacterium sp. TA1]|uniref:DUF882 domain-containing protein n=1 Tax=Thermodesulfobacterium sp. TA1 TaxID=2234087 RepID=UPI00123284FA|nr:DUF882 domain-containing protein [Thermodesulfobacterium sp. TA1]QER42394.1 DUF882 domain-containing protein [Thermodesulfobacterium sp. TA1]
MFTRRTFLKTLGLFLVKPVLSFGDLWLFPERTLKVYNIHTKEAIEATYWINGDYRGKEVSLLFYIFRDHRTGEVYPIDIKLFDLLFLITQNLEIDTPICLVSGYRAPETNEFLRKTTSGVVQNSLHTVGKAVDCFLPEIPLENIVKVALNLGLGGVGYYPGRFVHLDIGRPRFWIG